MTEHSILNNKKVVYYTLGCKLNFAETSTIGKMLSQRGVIKTKSGEKADICIINSCSVTELADKKCRQTIRRISRQHPNACIVVTGCYAQLKSEEVGAIEGVDMVLGAAEKMDLPDRLEAFLMSEQTHLVDTTPLAEIKNFAPSCSRGDRTRYFLKVQDGCDYYCSYCTIPFARGRSRNGSIESMVEQARQVAEEGGKEIVITGVNIGDFGKTTGETFLDLIKALDCVEGIERYRISSIEPDLLTDEAIEFIATSRRMAPHFHIPLQSGSDEVLKIMRRHYDKALFCSKINKIKSVMPDAFIGVDLIVGMRGETEELFNESFATVESLDISQLHVFTYSERPGTRALKIEHVVTPQEKHDRCTQMLALSEEKRMAFYKSQRGATRPVLFEQPAPGTMMHGFTDNYIRVEMPYDRSLVNKSGVRVLLGDFTEDKSSLNVEKLYIE
ncbi:MAG: tRNA (N(6)-L-threonylcarbamoyladenosine(37)-C(2))-methylthiotransferase MtaB [Bacteroidales bacterium]|nr:tRNA (N(6)-L-threonylcarbamoyladenosine(37)-C(2))-methylthiotransferase MtaB [Bacteroidales bacterium]